MRASYLFTSKSVSEGHPDKVCDRISDEIVDLFFREGPKAGIDPWAIRAACETLATTNKVVIAGETRGSEIGHQRPDRKRGPQRHQGHRLRAGRVPLAKTCDIEILLHPQSADIAARASMRYSPAPTRKRARATRASCSATPPTRPRSLMPAPIFYAHKILRLISEARHSGKEKGASGLQEPGHRAIRERQAGRRARDRGLAQRIDRLAVLVLHGDLALGVQAHSLLAGMAGFRSAAGGCLWA